MAQHDVEITISKTGEVKVRVKGAKAKTCLDYAKWLSGVVGNIKSQQPTGEFYEPDVRTRIDLRQELNREE